MRPETCPAHGVAVSLGVIHGYRSWALIALAALPLAFLPVQLALSNKSGRELLPMLGSTARLQMVVGLLLTIGIFL